MKKIIFCLALVAITYLNAQPNYRVETTARPTPGYDWKFNFMNMDTTPVLVKVVNTAEVKHFDPELKTNRPIDLLLPTKVPRASTEKNAVLYGHLRSTLDLTKYSSAALVILYDENGDYYESVYELPAQQEADLPVTLIWHQGTLAIEKAKRASFIDLQPKFHSLRHVREWDY